MTRNKAKNPPFSYRLEKLPVSVESYFQGVKGTKGRGLPNKKELISYLSKSTKVYKCDTCHVDRVVGFFFDLDIADFIDTCVFCYIDYVYRVDSKAIQKFLESHSQGRKKTPRAKSKKTTNRSSKKRNTTSSLVKPLNYTAYIKSSEWRETKRAQYWERGEFRECYFCGVPWLTFNGTSSLYFQLHHRTYKRLYKENLSDLVPLCKSCHDEVTDIWKKHFQKQRTSTSYKEFLSQWETTEYVKIRHGVRVDFVPDPDTPRLKKCSCVISQNNCEIH